MPTWIKIKTVLISKEAKLHPSEGEASEVTKKQLRTGLSREKLRVIFRISHANFHEIFCPF